MRRPFLAITLPLSAGAFAQTAPAVLNGMVVDAATQSPLGDAVVIARSPALPGEQAVVTDSSGAFEMTLLPPGTYSLAVKRGRIRDVFSRRPVAEGGKMRVRNSRCSRCDARDPGRRCRRVQRHDDRPAMISGPRRSTRPTPSSGESKANMQVR